MPARRRRRSAATSFARRARDKVTGAARYIDDLAVSESALRAHDPVDDSRRRDRSTSASTSTPTGFTIVDHRDIPGRNVVALIDDDQPCLAERDDPSRRRADPAARARGSRRAARRRRPDRLPRGTPDLRSRSVADRVQDDRDRQGRPRRRLRRGRRRSSKASTAPAIRSSSTSSRTA